MELTEDWVQQVIDARFDDVELVLLEEVGNRRNRVLRLYVDHPGGVTHELCARVSARWRRRWTRRSFDEGPTRSR